MEQELDYTPELDNEYDDYEDTSTEEVDYSDTHSVANKLASLLGEPEAAVEVEAPVKTPELVKETVPDLITVKVDGVEKQVTLDELKNGYQRQSDYTQKTQELSQQRQAVEAEKAQYNQYVQSIPMLAQVAQQNANAAVEQLYSQEMVELAQTDPAEYVAQKARIEQTIAENTKAFQQMQQQYADYQNQQQQVQSQQRQEMMTKGHELLSSQIDGWSNGSAQKAINDYALSAAELTAEELNNLYDPRYVKILNKARLYDELTSKTNVAQKRVAAVPPKTITSGSSQSDAKDDFNARKRAALKSGDSHKIAAIMAELL
ncbi:MAG: hypothetical protein ACXWT5_06075 [Methylophilus sp.]